jgi:hypothetical protein
MKRRVFLQGLCIIPTIGLCSPLDFIDEIIPVTNSGLDIIIDIIQSDKGLKRKVSQEEIDKATNAVKRMNEILSQAIVDIGVVNNILVADVKELNSHIFYNYYDEWVLLYGNFHNIVKRGAKTRLFGKNAINKVFKGIYCLGFETGYKRRLSDIDGVKSVSFKRVAKWLNNLIELDAKEEDSSTPSIVEDLEILVPLYSYPTKRDNSDNLIWQRVIDIKSKYPTTKITAIVNQSNGEFREKDSNYFEGIKRLVDADIKVIGYVYTNYGERPAEDVTDDIESWSNIYKESGLSGIFFDETSTDSSSLDYYTQLSNEAKNRGLEFIVLNPGTTTNQSYIDSNISNIIVSCEYTYNRLKDNPPSTYNTPTKDTKLSLLVYRMDENGVDELISFAREHRFTYIYFTEDGFDGNPWDSLSQYFEEEVRKIL